MDLATCITILLTLGTYLNGVVTLEECTGQGQSPEVKLGISIKKPEKKKQFQLFKIYNLPIPLPEVNLQVQYDLTFKYLAITT